jgi:hypothetical protein
VEGKPVAAISSQQNTLPVSVVIAAVVVVHVVVVLLGVVEIALHT